MCHAYTLRHHSTAMRRGDAVIAVPHVRTRQSALATSQSQDDCKEDVCNPRLITNKFRRISLPLLLAITLSVAFSGALTYLFVSDNLGSVYTHSIVENGTKSEAMNVLPVIVTFFSILLPATVVSMLFAWLADQKSRS